MVLNNRRQCACRERFIPGIAGKVGPQTLHWKAIATASEEGCAAVQRRCLPISQPPLARHFSPTRSSSSGVAIVSFQRLRNPNTKRVAWTKENVRDLKTHSKSKTPVAKISKLMKRSEGAIRQKALALDISIGHRR
jgi:hypothetical protein